VLLLLLLIAAVDFVTKLLPTSLLLLTKLHSKIIAAAFKVTTKVIAAHQVAP